MLATLAAAVDIAFLILRLQVGLLFFAHGAQKAFGWFGGRGFSSRIRNMEQMGVHPAFLWALINTLGELLGGLGLAAGLLTPLAAAGIIGSMIVAIGKVHWRNGFFNSNDGIEFPLTLLTAAFAVGLAGPGMYSLDYLVWSATGLALPQPVTYVVALVLMLAGVIPVLLMAPPPATGSASRPS